MCIWLAAGIGPFETGCYRIRNGPLLCGETDIFIFSVTAGGELHCVGRAWQRGSVGRACQPMWFEAACLLNFI